MHQQSLFNQAEQERLEAQARAEASGAAAQQASEAKAAALEKLDASKKTTAKAVANQEKSCPCRVGGGEEGGGRLAAVQDNEVNG